MKSKFKLFTPQKISISVVHVVISLTYSFHNVYMFQNMLYMIDIKFYLFFKIIKNNVSENTGILI